ncbi:hypothetical protein [Acinetobacter variabilis]|uniref:hypothetical protein n=1 Tax=Acinetobacter variabilis TaxID=70346 RepID=UPI0026712952|nr:hypothetical protein [Acinetobacter variabilis]WKT72200.1 hypothetical protein Q3F87_10080 [Acinetobacter variabilis]
MLSNPTISELQKRQQEFYIADIRLRSSDGAVILYFDINHVSEQIKTNHISHIQINNLIKKLNQDGIEKVEVIYIQSDRLESLAKGFELILESQFSEFIENAELSFLSSEKVNVWLKMRVLDDNTKLTIESFLKNILNESNINYFDIHWIGEQEDFPSVMKILIDIKILQPISLENYFNYLLPNFDHITSRWLNRELDKLIKKGFITREAITASYSLTAKGLLIIPNVPSNSNSDIKRALSLGRRKW